MCVCVCVYTETTTTTTKPCYIIWRLNTAVPQPHRIQQNQPQWTNVSAAPRRHIQHTHTKAIYQKFYYVGVHQTEKYVFLIRKINNLDLHEWFSRQVIRMYTNKQTQTPQTHQTRVRGKLNYFLQYAQRIHVYLSNRYIPTYILIYPYIPTQGGPEEFISL